MSYAILADLIIMNKREVAQAIAEDAINYCLPLYGQVALKELTATMENHLDVLARYVRTNNPAEYRQHMRQFSLKPMEPGTLDDSLLAISSLVIETLERMLDHEIPDYADSKLRDQFKNRIRETLTLGRYNIFTLRLGGM